LSGAGVRQMPQFRGLASRCRVVGSSDIDSLVLALAGSGVSETRWTLFRYCRPASNNDGERARRGGAPFLLLDVGGVGLVHGIEHIDLPQVVYDGA